jgi:hypothetical protein
VRRDRLKHEIAGLSFKRFSLPVLGRFNKIEGTLICGTQEKQCIPRWRLPQPAISTAQNIRSK